MEWTNPANADISYLTRVVFDNDALSWTVLVKDWQGKVLLQQEGRAGRRNDCLLSTRRWCTRDCKSTHCDAGNPQPVNDLRANF